SHEGLNEVKFCQDEEELFLIEVAGPTFHEDEKRLVKAPQRNEACTWYTGSNYVC
ncbi:11271_t:CDS:2, partial [Paraglomus brasilianum]